MEVARRKRFHEIQILRAVAAGLVVAAHSIVEAWPQDTNAISLAWCLGDIGVGIFFVISGFIMVHVSERDFGRPGASSKFISRRIERIVPFYWLATIVSIPKLFDPKVSYGGMHAKIVMILKSLFFIPYQNIDGLMRPVHSVGWTLNFEMLFYVVFAACLALPTKKKAVLSSVCFLIGLIAVGAVFSDGAYGDVPHTIFQFLTYPIVALFAAGMLIALFLGRFEPSVQIPNSAIVMSLIPVAVILVFMIFVREYPVSLSWRVVVWSACVICVLGTIVLDRKDIQTNVLTKKLEILGDASYSVYLFHPFALIFVKHLDRLVSGGPFVKFLLCLVAGHLVGLGMNRFVEKPVLSWFARQRTEKSRISAPASESAS